MGTQPIIIRRDEIEGITSIVVDNQKHELGLHKDFRRHPALRELLPEAARLSLAWVRLQAGEVLGTHEHPTASMIILTSGNGRLSVGQQTPLEEGDIVFVPPGVAHGFIGEAPAGFWGLSVQFEGNGLYEDPNTPRVQFLKSEAAVRSPGLARLLERKEYLQRDYLKNPLFELIRSPSIRDRQIRDRMLESLQVWSNQFQKIVMFRYALSEQQAFAALAWQHLAEEFGHHRRLAEDRGTDRVEVWDPVLEGTSSWFVLQMTQQDDLSRSVLVHLVLEAAGASFHQIASPIMRELGKSDYFAQHDELDADHERMGLALLDGLDEATYRRLTRVLEDGWAMFGVLCSRIAHLAETA
jgi:quercetin dioxygenase-like cupin family protein